MLYLHSKAKDVSHYYVTEIFPQFELGKVFKLISLHFEFGKVFKLISLHFELGKVFK